MKNTLCLYILTTGLGLTLASFSGCASDINAKPAGDCWWMSSNAAICYSHGYKSDGFNNPSNAGMHLKINVAKQSDGQSDSTFEITPVNPDNHYCKTATDSTCVAKIVVNNHEYPVKLTPEFVGNGSVLTNYYVNEFLSDKKALVNDIKQATTFNVVLKDKENKDHMFKFTAKAPLQTHKDNYFDWKDLP